MYDALTSVRLPLGYMYMNTSPKWKRSCLFFQRRTHALSVVSLLRQHVAGEDLLVVLADVTLQLEQRLRLVLAQPQRRQVALRERDGQVLQSVAARRADTGGASIHSNITAALKSKCLLYY